MVQEFVRVSPFLGFIYCFVIIIYSHDYVLHNRNMRFMYTKISIDRDKFQNSFTV